MKLPFKSIKIWSLQEKVLLGFRIALFLLVLMGFYLLDTFNQVVDSTNRIEETQKILLKIEDISSRDLAYAESMQYAYVLTGNSDYLEVYNGIIQALREDYSALKSMTLTNPEHNWRMQPIADLIHSRLFLTQEMFDKFPKQAISPQLADLTYNGAATMELLFNHTNSMEEIERQNLKVQIERAKANLHKTFINFGFVVFVVFVLLGGLYWLINEEIQKRQQAEAGLRISEERYALAAQGTNDGLWDWNLENNEIYFSDRWKRILGFESEEFQNNLEEWLSRVYSEDRERLQKDIDSHFKGETPYLHTEYRIQHKNGNLIWVLTRGISMHNEATDKPYRFAGSLTDITDRKRDEEALIYEATHDPLTGLLNRQALMNQLFVELETAKRHQYPLSLCMCDLDKFKHVNDTYGHLVGDAVIIQFAREIQQNIRVTDLAARFGGDEFCIVFPRATVEEACQILERVRGNLAKHVFHSDGGATFSITSTFGIGAFNEKLDEKALLELADQALYKAKASRNKIEVFF